MKSVINAIVPLTITAAAAIASYLLVTLWFSGAGADPASAFYLRVIAGVEPAAPAAPPAAPGSGKLGFSAVLIDNSTGEPVPEGTTKTVKFSIWDAATDGTKLYEETQSVTVKKSGVFRVFLGTVTSFPDGLFENETLFVEVQVDPDPPMTPRQEIAKVPRAFHADKAAQSEKAQRASKAEALARSGFLATTVDTPVSALDALSMTIGADGLGIIAYYSSSTGSVKVAHCEDSACATSITTSVGPSAGGAISIVIGSDGLPLIAASDGIFHCDDLLCSSVTTSLGVDNDPTVAIGVDGLPLIAAEGGGGVRTSHCADVACSGSSFTGVAGGSQPSITIGADGLPVISYYAGALPTGGLRLRHCADALCNSFDADSVVDADWGGIPAASIAIGTDGMPVLAYIDLSGDMKLAHCGTVTCSSASISTVQGNAEIGPGASIAIGSDGLPIAIYSSLSPSGLAVAHCSDIACSSVTRVGVQSPADTGAGAVTVGTDGLPLISYKAKFLVDFDLVGIHCSNHFCVPHHRAR